MVHLYKFDDMNIVLDVFSGAIHLVDEVAFEIISMYEEKSKDEIKEYILDKYKDDETVTSEDLDECFENIEGLISEGKLFAPDKYEKIAKNFKMKNFTIKALCLHVAHVCNLSCAYCFASQGKYKGDRALMSYEVGKQAIDFLIANSGTHKNLDIDFFGGEPLMNFDVVKQLVAYGRQVEKENGKNIRFTLTTNGINLDADVIDFLNKEMHNVVLSLDGRKEVNDRFRVDYSGNGSYDKIVPKFQDFVEKRGDKSYYLRGTYTHHNVDFVNDIKHMLDLGFNELSMEPVVCKPEEESALTNEDLPILFKQYEDLAHLMIERNRAGKPFTFYHYMISLTGGPCIYKRVTGCGSGTEYLAVTPWGELFPCHQFVGKPEFSMGNVYDGVTNTELRDEFAKTNVYSRKECENCWAKLYCAGGCAANSFNSTGTINGVYEYGCELFRKRIECAIAVKLTEYRDSAK